MLWGGFSFEGKSELAEAAGIQNSTKYVEALRNYFLPFAGTYHGDNFILQQDSASIRASKEADRWQKTMSINHLQWPANSPDLNFIDSLWGALAREAYKNRRQFKKKEDLRKCAFETWDSIKGELLPKLVDSMKSRRNEALLAQGGKARY